MKDEIFVGVYFCRLAISCVLRELIFAIFRKYPVPALIIFSFLLSTCNRNTYFQTINQYFIVYHFVSEWNNAGQAFPR